MAPISFASSAWSVASLMGWALHLSGLQVGHGALTAEAPGGPGGPQMPQSLPEDLVPVPRPLPVELGVAQAVRNEHQELAA